MKTITVEIDPAGQVTIETAGFKGAACAKATAAVEAALGTKSSDTKKPEFYQQTEVKVGQYVGGVTPYPKGRY